MNMEPTMRLRWVRRVDPDARYRDYRPYATKPVLQQLWRQTRSWRDGDTTHSQIVAEEWRDVPTVDDA